MERHFDDTYKVLAVGCNEEKRGETLVVAVVARKTDGSRVRLEIYDCHHEAAQLPKLAKECHVLVLYYCSAEELKRYMLAVFPHLNTLARVVRVCVSAAGNAERAPYHFPMSEPSDFYVELDNEESRLLSQVFWQELALGPDYRNMEATDNAGRHRIAFDTSSLPEQLDPSPSPSRCFIGCSIA